MVARSPSRAPWPTRLGSCDRMARRARGLAFRNRRTSSSMSVVFPAPPAQVMPIVRVARDDRRVVGGEYLDHFPSALRSFDRTMSLGCTIPDLIRLVFGWP